MADSTKTGLCTVTISRAELLEEVGRFAGPTTTGELEDLKDARHETAWHQFSDRYRPMIMNYAQKRFRLSSADAEEAAQGTMIAFAVAYQKGQYDREKGRLRKWLFGIATNQIRNLQRKRGQNREVQIVDQTTGTGFIAHIPDDGAELEKIWEEAWRQAVYQQCIKEVRVQFDRKTVQAFELFARQGLSAQEVADKLGMTQNAVFLAKHKILKRIRELIPLMEANW